MIGRRRTRLTREGWYYLLVLAFVVTGALLREINLLIIMSGLLIGPLLLNWRMVVGALRPLKVSRRAAEVVSAEEAFSVDLVVNSRPSWFARLALGSWAPGSWGVTIDDVIRRLGPGLPRNEVRTGVFFWRIGRGETARLAYRGRLMKRGRYRLGPLTLSTRFPLGLVRRTIHVDAVQDVLVLPRQGRLTPAWQTLCRRILHSDRGRRIQTSVMDGDFHSLRDWRPGDARRQIHWRTTARRRTPTVRRFELPHNADVALLLDICQTTAAAGSEDDETVEHAIRFAATVLGDLCRQNSGRVILGVAGQTANVFRGSASAGLLRECLEHLATLEAGSGAALHSMVSDVLTNLRRDARVVVVSTRSQRDMGEEAVGLLQDWVAAGGMPTSPTLVLSAAQGELDEFFVCDRGEVHA